jgi:outer membrane lipoprotein SlyB
VKRLFVPFIAFIVALAGCASPGPSYPPEIRQGRIEQITEVPLDHPHQIGVGAILGGAAGAGLGSLVGGGTGKDVAIAVGAIAGAIGGQYAENKYEAKKAGQQIVVRLNSGVLVVITQAADPSLRVGQRVYVQGAGSDARLVPQ